MFKTLNFEVRDRVGYVQFSTPDTLNSLSEARIEDLEAVIARVKADAEIRALTITGSGRAFCVGLDLELLKRAFNDPVYFEKTIRRLQAVLLDLESLPVPVIAAVNGYARAGGFELAIACDLMVIADEAKIGDRHTNLGVLPGGGISQRLPRRVGEQRAKALVLLAPWLSGEQAVAYGLALRSVPLADLPAAVEEMLSELRHRPRECSAAIKSAMHAARTLDSAQAVEFEIQTFVKYMVNLPYGREGYEASLAGRPPNWY
jgi:enoyl-CoA hydratase/carnithine racemase